MVVAIVRVVIIMVVAVVMMAQKMKTFLKDMM